METSTENNFTTEAQPSGSSVDWSGALQSSEFRAGLAEFVANTLTQMKDSTSESPSGSHAGVEAVGNVMPGTGDVVVSQPQFEPTNAQGTSIIAPSLLFGRWARATVYHLGKDRPASAKTLKPNITPSITQCLQFKMPQVHLQLQLASPRLLYWGGTPS